MAHAKSFAATAGGVLVGSLAGGPIGLLVGGGAGASIDWYRKHRSRPKAGAGLPAGADLPSASAATHLLLLGSHNAAPAAAFYLQKFQTSMGLPATGQVDAQTRSALVAATRGGPYDASKLP